MRREIALARDCQNGSTEGGLTGGSEEERDAHFIQPSRMRSVTVWVLALLPGVCGAAGHNAQEVSGTLGGSLTVHCKYSQDYKGYSHYWCKPKLGVSCSKAIESKGSKREVKKGRYSIKDSPATLTFTVTMRGLRESDSGLYWCGTKGWGHDNKEEVKVTVLSSATKKPSTNKSLTNMILPAAPSAFSITSMSQPEEMNPTPYTITALSLPGEATTEVHSTTMDAIEDPSSSPAPGTLPWSLAPAALLALIPLAAIGAWVIRKRSKSLDAAGVQSDVDTSLPDLPSKHIMENPQYVTVGNPAAGGRVPVYSMIECGPASAISDPGGWDPVYSMVECGPASASSDPGRRDPVYSMIERGPASATSDPGRWDPVYSMIERGPASATSDPVYAAIQILDSDANTINGQRPSSAFRKVYEPGDPAGYRGYSTAIGPMDRGDVHYEPVCSMLDHHYDSL